MSPRCSHNWVLKDSGISLKDKVDMERWARGIRRQAIRGGICLAGVTNQSSGVDSTAGILKDERRVHSWKLLKKPYDLPKFLQCSHSSWSPTLHWHWEPGLFPQGIVTSRCSPNKSLSSMAIKNTCNYEQSAWWGLRALFKLWRRKISS